jgi:hypothetical protein
MNNQTVIQQIQEQTAPVMEKMANRTVREFRMGDLEIDNGISLRGMPLRGKAVRNVLGNLRVKSNFTDLFHKMTPEDWRVVSHKLKQAEGETKMYAKIFVNDQGEQEIIDTFNHNDKKKSTDEGDVQQYIDWITSNLAESEKEYSLKGLNFDSNKEVFNLTLLDANSDTDVFGTGIDIWKMGDRFTFGGLQFSYAPFFERLVCSNGNTATEYGFASNISQAKFNNKRIETTIEKALKYGSETLPAQLQQAVQHLRTNNVSMAEFYEYRRFFESRNENDKYMRIINEYFNDQPFFQSYGVNITEKSRKWKSTANTGINAYDFFNMLTYIASHPEKVMMDLTDRTNLQIQASNLLFKRELDLEDVATPVKVLYPRHSSMN